MKICMLVYNNVTKDNRVIREAETLQAAGHQVTIVGIPDNEASAPVESLESGVQIRRVLWQASAYGKLLKSAVLRVVPLLLLLGLLVWAAWVIISFVVYGLANIPALYDSFMHHAGAPLAMLGVWGWIKVFVDALVVVVALCPDH